MRSENPSITTRIVSSPDGPAFDKQGTNATAAVRLAHEAAVLRAATHPGVVELVESEPGRLRTAMVGTRTWAQAPPRSAEGFALAAAQLASTLCDLHALGITHGSIEPAHIINGTSGRPVLCSFSAGRLDATDEDQARDIAAFKLTVRDIAPFCAEPTRAASVADALNAAADLESMVRIASDMAVQPEAKPSRRNWLARHGPLRDKIALVGWGFALITALVGLHTIGANNLPSPSVRNWGDFMDWLSSADPAVIVLTGVRLIALALTYYLVFATVLSAIDALRSAAKVRRVLPRRLEHLTHAALGAGLLSSVIAPFITDQPPSGDTALISTEPLADHDQYPPPRPADRLGAAPPSNAAFDDASPLHRVETSFRSIPSPTAKLENWSEVSPTWTVEVGDHLWAIAEESLADEWGRAPSDPQIVEYWLALIEKNQPRLVDADNPDLIIPGQIIELPPIGVDPAD